MDNESKAAKRGRGRPPAGGDQELPREKLLQAALCAFAEHGYEGMSMRTLAQQLGISHGLLNLRFGTKQRLWEASVEYGLDQFRERMISLPREGSLKARFTFAVSQILEAIGVVPEMLRLLNNEGTTQSARLDHIADTILAERYSRLEEVISEGVGLGILHEMPAQLVTVLVAHGGGVLFGLKPLAVKLGLLEKGDAGEMALRAQQIGDFMWRGLLRRQDVAKEETMPPESDDR
ncbi:TetR/AcrR family transcriptional regulator [Sphingobium aquiterrae]|uniref:TetR/AcrR family transcriptional regulator n=1 Tax=Sphingobium aquiterrae TaxID=2038656 RepID=UPI003019456E